MIMKKTVLLIFINVLISSIYLLAQKTHYRGNHHTYSHGGNYVGGQGSSHKGGHYVNKKTNNHYGAHKTSQRYRRK